MRKIICFSVLLLSSVFSFAQQPQLFSTKHIADIEKKGTFGHAAFTEDPATNNYDVTYTRCQWTFADMNQKFIAGTITTYFKPTVNSFDKMIMDLLANMTIDSILYHGKSVSFSRPGDEIQIDYPDVIPNGNVDSLSIIYHGTPNGTTSFTTYFDQTTHGSSPTIWSLSEPYGAYYWWPCKNSLTDKIDSLDIYVTCPNGYRDGSNGLLVDSTTSAGMTTYHWKHRYPIATYLVAVNVANFQSYTDHSIYNGDTLNVLNYIYPEDLLNWEGNTPNLLPAIHLYDSLFELYPFAKEKYGMAEFTWGGGMEHQTFTYISSNDFETMAHECAHQWFGDKVTCASWHDIWLNESFATFLTRLCYDNLLNHVYEMQWRTNDISYITQIPDGSVYVPDTTDVNRIFDSRLSYVKGSFVLHMLQWELGDSAFFAGLRAYLDDANLAYGFAHTSDLQNHLQIASGKDLTGFFNQWYYQQGYPSYRLTWDQQGDNSVDIKVNQTQSDPSVSYFVMDLPVELKGAGHDTIVRLQNNSFDGQFYSVQVNFKVSQVIFDPQLWILSAQNVEITSVNSPPIKSFNIQIKPNPAHSEAEVHMQSPVPENINLEVFDVTGKMILSTNVFINNQTQLNLDTRLWATGAYFLQYRSANNNGGLKLLVQ